MLVLRANLDDLELITSAAADIEPHISAMQADAGTPPVVQPLPNLGPIASVTSATTVQIVDTSGITNAHVVNVKGLNLRNNHASTSCDVTLQVADGTTTATLFKCTLLAGEVLALTENGAWIHYDANGGIYQAQPPIATQTDMETPTAIDKIVTPGRQHFHPGMAKFVCMTTGGATPVMQTPPSYNMTSITDAGAGRLTVTIATDFSSANWCCLCTNEGESTTLTEAGLVNTSYLRTSTLAAGSVEVNSRDGTGTTNVLNDPPSWHVAGFGDQA